MSVSRRSHRSGSRHRSAATQEWEKSHRSGAPGSRVSSSRGSRTTYSSNRSSPARNSSYRSGHQKSGQRSGRDSAMTNGTNYRGREFRLPTGLNAVAEEQYKPFFNITIVQVKEDGDDVGHQFYDIDTLEVMNQNGTVADADDAKSVITEGSRRRKIRVRLPNGNMGYISGVFHPGPGTDKEHVYRTEQEEAGDDPVNADGFFYHDELKNEDGDGFSVVSRLTKKDFRSAQKSGSERNSGRSAQKSGSERTSARLSSRPRSSRPRSKNMASQYSERTASSRISGSRRSGSRQRSTHNSQSARGGARTGRSERTTPSRRYIESEREEPITEALDEYIADPCEVDTYAQTLPDPADPEPSEFANDDPTIRAEEVLPMDY